jgi:hypothetical protein
MFVAASVVQVSLCYTPFLPQKMDLLPFIRGIPPQQLTCNIHIAFHKRQVEEWLLSLFSGDVPDQG